jgi:hypothetical protein
MDQLSASTIIASRSQINNAGKFRVKVTSSTPYFKQSETGSNQVAIVNFNAMTMWHLKEAQALFLEGDFQGATNQALSASIREKDYLPAKGEMVDIMVEEVTTKAGVTGLFVTGITPIAAVTASKVNMASFLGTPTTVNVEEVPAFAAKLTK